LPCALAVVALLVMVALLPSAASADRPSARAAAAAPALELDSRGPRVARVQRRIGVTVDRHFGRVTQAAVKRFQKRHGLAADGVVGPATWREMGFGAWPEKSDDAGSGVGGTVPAVLRRIAMCESGGNPRAVSRDGRYRGKYQFLVSTWEGVGGTGDPAAAPEAEQDQRAAALMAAEGTKPWPVCGPRAERTQ